MTTKFESIRLSYMVSGLEPYIYVEDLTIVHIRPRGIRTYLNTLERQYQNNLFLLVPTFNVNMLG